MTSTSSGTACRSPRWNCTKRCGRRWRGIAMVQGVSDRSWTNPNATGLDPLLVGCYPLRQINSPADFALREKLVILDSDAFGTRHWHRDHSAGLPNIGPTPLALLQPPTARIAWTPGVADLRVRRTAASELEVQIRSATPNCSLVVRGRGQSQPSPTAAFSGNCATAKTRSRCAAAISLACWLQSHNRCVHKPAVGPNGARLSGKNSVALGSAPPRCGKPAPHRFALRHRQILPHSNRPESPPADCETGQSAID